MSSKKTNLKTTSLLKVNKPIKRHPSLQNLSREHHDILVFGLRLKKGIQKKASSGAMNQYVNWFWNDYLKAHFEVEEKHLFPMFPNCEHLAKAENSHQEIRDLLENKMLSVDQLEELYVLVEKNIRFEERMLFNEIQTIANENQLKKFSNIHPRQQTCSIWHHQFWK